MRLVKRVLSVGILTLASVLVASGTALAHVVVRPGEVKTGERVTFAVSVPNEHQTPVVQVRIEIPEGVESITPYAKTGWEVQLEQSYGDDVIDDEETGEVARVTAIVWKGGQVPIGMKDDFLFGAKAPAADTELQWKAYETYGDGTVVAWDQEPSEAEGNKPYSVTKIVSQTEAEATIARAEQAAADADKAADRAMYTAIIAIVVAAFSLVMILRGPKES